MSDETSRLVPGRARFAAWGALALVAAFVAATFIVPLAESAWPEARMLRFAWSPVCHQNPERSLVVGESVQAVCTRCSGLYLGGLGGMVVAAVWMIGRRPPRPRWLVALALPTLVDFALPLLGMAQLANVPRLLLALPPGFLAGLYLAMGIGEVFGADPSARSVGAPRAVRVAEERS